MREMKDSGVEWIGEIPFEWMIYPLFTKYDEGKNKNKEGKEKNLLSLSYGKIIRKSIDSNDGLIPENYNGYNIVDSEDIIIRPTDLQNDKRSLRTGLVKETGIITSAYIDLKPKKNVNSRYYHYLLHSYDECKVFYNMGNGVRQGINYSLVSKLPIISPSSDEQKRIADYLDSKCALIDSIISKQEQIIEKLKEYKLSVITEAVTKGLNPDAEMKDSRVEWIGELPNSWSVGKLGSLFEFVGGYAFNSDDYVPESDYQVIRIGNVKNDYMPLESNPVYVSKDKALEASKFEIKEGYILFTMTGTKGKRDYFYTYLVRSDDLIGKKLYINQRVGAFVSHSNVCAGYYNYLLKETRILDSIFLYETGTANQGNLGIDSIRRTRVQIPPLEQQKDIAIFLDNKCTSINKSINERKMVISKLQDYKKSLVYEVVTGKKEV